MTWVVLGFVLALASGLLGLPYAVLFRPWRVKRLAYFLMTRSPWYRSWVFRLMLRRMSRANQKIAVAMGALVPAAKRGTTFRAAVTAEMWLPTHTPKASEQTPAASNTAIGASRATPRLPISRVNGGGGNRTRVTCLPESPLSSENASGSSDDDPSPPLVAPLRLLSGVELASAIWGTEV